MVTSVRRSKSRKPGTAKPADSRQGRSADAAGAATSRPVSSRPVHGASAGGGHARGETNGYSRRGQSQTMQLSVLVLNRNYAAIHVVSVQRAFCLLYKESAEVVDIDGGHFLSYNFERWCENSQLKKELLVADDTEDWIRAVNFEIQAPRVIRLLRYDRFPRNSIKFNRRNIFLRDEHCCQYCRKSFPRHQLSLDHIMPRSRGGANSWENIVCACLPCNVRKGGRTPQEAGMALMKPPTRPQRSPLISRQLSDRRYSSWSRFLHAD